MRAFVNKTFVWSCPSSSDYEEMVSKVESVQDYCEENGIEFVEHYHPYEKSLAFCVSSKSPNLAHCKIEVARIGNMLSEELGRDYEVTYYHYGDSVMDCFALFNTQEN